MPKLSLMRVSTSHQQDDQHDQQDGAETAADIRTAVVEAAAAKQNHKNDNKEDEVHEVAPVRNHCCAAAPPSRPSLECPGRVVWRQSMPLTTEVTESFHRRLPKSHFPMDRCKDTSCRRAPAPASPVATHR